MNLIYETLDKIYNLLKQDKKPNFIKQFTWETTPQEFWWNAPLIIGSLDPQPNKIEEGIIIGYTNKATIGATPESIDAQDQTIKYKITIYFNSENTKITDISYIYITRNITTTEEIIKTIQKHIAQRLLTPLITITEGFQKSFLESETQRKIEL